MTGRAGYSGKVMEAMMGDMYRTNFGPVGDGSTDTSEQHDAWMEVQGLVKDGWLVAVRPTYYQTKDCIDPEDVLIDWLTEHGVDRPNAYNISHHLVHSVLYSVARAVKCAVLDTAEKNDDV